jgi:hypothetical protein
MISVPPVAIPDMVIAMDAHPDLRYPLCHQYPSPVHRLARHLKRHRQLQDRSLFAGRRMERFARSVCAVPNMDSAELGMIFVQPVAIPAMVTAMDVPFD